MKLKLLCCVALLLSAQGFATTNRMYYPSDQPPLTAFLKKPTGVIPNVSVLIVGSQKKEYQNAIEQALAKLFVDSTSKANLIILGTETTEIHRNSAENIVGNPYCQSRGYGLEMYNGYFYYGIPRDPGQGGLNGIWNMAASIDKNRNVHQALYEATKALRSLPILLWDSYSNCSSSIHSRDGYVTRPIKDIGKSNPRNVCSVDKHIVVVDIDNTWKNTGKLLKSITPKDYKVYFNINDPENVFKKKITQKSGSYESPTRLRISPEGLYSNLELEINNENAFAERLANLAHANNITINTVTTSPSKYGKLVQHTNGKIVDIPQNYLTTETLSEGLLSIIADAHNKQQEINRPIVSKYLSSRWFSNTNSVMDRPMADIFEKEPNINDLSSLGAIRYHSVYDFDERKGDIYAVAPYLDGDIVKTKTIWKLSDVHSNLNAKVDHYTVGYSQKNWTTTTIGKSGNVLGSMAYSNIALANKDVLYTNLNHYGGAYKNALIDYLKDKIHYQPNNYIIASDDNGSIFFINAIRGAKNKNEIGKVVTSITTEILNPEQDALLESTVRMGGKTKIADGFVYSWPTPVVLTMGVTGMGSGGKMIIGYKIAGLSNYNRKIEVNFVISNEVESRYGVGSPDYKKDYGDLGYTYSDFETYSEKDRTIALFGNGYGVERSVLYAMDMHSGSKIREIILNNKGYGASSPTLITKVGEDGLPLIDRIYIGDYAGNLYKISFNNGKITSDYKIEHLYKVDNIGIGQNVISVKPLAVEIQNDSGSNSGYAVYFGTGLLGVSQDATDTQKIIKVTDDNVNDRFKEGKITYLATNSLKYDQDQIHKIKVTLPFDYLPNNKLKHTDYFIPLNEDGKNSNEQIVFEPVLEFKNNTVLFSTWASKKNFGTSTNMTQNYENICFNSDLPYGKRIALPLEVTETEKVFDLDGLSNVGNTMTIFGQINGDYITTNNDPYYNFHLFSINQQKEIIDLMGESNSTYYYDKEIPYGAYCTGDIYGRVLCSRSFRKKAILFPKRLSIHKKISS